MDSVSAPRRAWTRQVTAMGLAVVVGVFGLVGVHRSEGRADAASPIGEAAPAVELPVPPPLLTLDPPTTTTTAPPETTTTTAPPETTTTTTAPPPAPPAPATSGPA